MELFRNDYERMGEMRDMPRKKCEALTREQFETLVETIEKGFNEHRPNRRIATLLIAQANLGLRVGDMTNLHLSDIVWHYDRYHIEITEEKTGKKRDFTVPVQIYEYLKKYAQDNHIGPNERLFKITPRMVNKLLIEAAEYCGYDPNVIASHSFRKFFATQIYVNNNYNISLVQKLLQHSSPTITQRYIGIQQKDVEEALNNNVNIPGVANKNPPEETSLSPPKEAKPNKKQSKAEKDKEAFKNEILKELIKQLSNNL